MTNRELVQMAMPLISLSESEWNYLSKYIEKNVDLKLLSILKKLQTNQSRLEVMSNYFDYYCDKLDEPVRESNVELQAV